MKPNFSELKKAFFKFIKGAAVKAALKKILGSAAAGGLRGWIIKFIVLELFDELFIPLLKYGFNMAGYVLRKEKGKIIAEKINRARDEKDEQAYNDAIGTIFGRKL